jgi:FlaA1/EpsC-like NDP-sugar epimerase
MTRPPTAWHRLDLFLARLRPRREPLSLAVDALVIAACWHITYLFRLGFERWATARPDYDLWVMLGVVAAYLLAFALFKVPQSMWRFSGFGEVQRLTLACMLAGLVSAVVVMGLGLTKVPRAVLALHPVVALMGVCVVRIAYRMLYEHARRRITGSDREIRRAIVMGAGAAARLLLAGVHEQGWIVLGLLDDDPAKKRARIGGIAVLGPLEAIADKAVRGAATHVIVAMPSASPTQRRRAFELAAATGLPVVTVPSADELREGRSRVERLRDIEAEDLLGRAPVQLDEAGIAETIAGKTVLITGAGGSIGSELCRQLARYRPARLVLFDQSEFNLYRIDQELAEAQAALPAGPSAPAVQIVPLIGDVKDLAQLRQTCSEWRPQVVFHAAAYKHVPLMEHHNAGAALANNTLGTWHAALAAAEAGVERFVLISTDKAVNPTNVMGASKRAAERVILGMAARHPGTRFMAVRFGNVLGSSGSVIPRFKEQIAKGGPITVTHPDIIRYFMTIPEAARLVLQAGAIGETGQVLVLDMGEPVKIVDLARDLIRLSGHTPDEIGIVFSGLRPGEKLYEELLAETDTTLPTPIPRLRIARLGEHGAAAENGDAGQLGAILAAWLQQTPMPSPAAVRGWLAAAVPEFHAPPAGLDVPHDPGRRPAPRPLAAQERP